MKPMVFTRAQLVLSDCIVESGQIGVVDGRLVDPQTLIEPQFVDLAGRFLAPGFVDLHVHGGDGADFMDLTSDAFRTVCRCHARHGTTTLTPTSTVARYDQYVQFLELCRHFVGTNTGGARIVGGHLYGPYFAPEAKGCHPAKDFLTPDPIRDEQLLSYAGSGLKSLTVAPEFPGSDLLVRVARERGLLCTAGHSYATMSQMEDAIGWGVRHIDHLFCAMSDRARLRQYQTYPMRGGVLEATLLFDELTTEVIADGKHLSADLLRLAYKIKGPDRLALVTDAMRAVDQPDGEYWFGCTGDGERICKRDGVGLMPDGKSLASGVMGLDHCVRTFRQLTNTPIYEVIRMASLTPARILGIESDCGSLEYGKRADFLVMDEELNIEQVFIAGQRVV